ncbi:hypothetical protein MKZ38_005052 [Zalerion maritima]|uniref:Uncharacterized protein n=1 Tax=Zalerion maritima TaxID=339359 RepID=A0AAD5RKI9_9PEZI|nr:hypothetical protein MKZ38_005052 [Zalerion maritima]
MLDIWDIWLDRDQGMACIGRLPNQTVLTKKHQRRPATKPVMARPEDSLCRSSFSPFHSPPFLQLDVPQDLRNDGGERDRDADFGTPQHGTGNVLHECERSCRDFGGSRFAATHREGCQEAHPTMGNTRHSYDRHHNLTNQQRRNMDDIPSHPSPDDIPNTTSTTLTTNQRMPIPPDILHNVAYNCVAGADDWVVGIYGPEIPPIAGLHALSDEKFDKKNLAW